MPEDVSCASAGFHPTSQDPLSFTMVSEGRPSLGVVAPGAGDPKHSSEPTCLASLFVRLSGEAAHVPLRITMDSDMLLISPSSEVAIVFLATSHLLLNYFLRR